MATATIERDDEQLVSIPEPTLLFMSRRDGLRLTKKSRWPIRNPVTGQREGDTKGQFVGFREGVFRCPKSGTVEIVDTLDGGVSEVDAEELVAYLRKHRLFGDTHDGFWEVDPTAPPISEDEMRRMMQAAMRLDVDTLRAIVEQERAGWGRDGIINQATEAIETIETARAAQAEGEPETAAPEAKPAPRRKA